MQAGGLGPITYPLLSDFNKKIARDYDVLVENAGVALRGLFIIDPKVHPASCQRGRQTETGQQIPDPDS
jgi:alkyl hydroperoxide reductase subunit AhpC